MGHAHAICYKAVVVRWFAAKSGEPPNYFGDGKYPQAAEELTAVQGRIGRGFSGEYAVKPGLPWSAKARNGLAELSMTALYLTEADVERLVDIRTAIQAVEDAFRRLAEGDAHNVPRARVRSPGIVLHTMSAAAAYANLVGWKCYTTTSGGGGKFLVGLYDAQTGNLVALVEADRLGQLRTAATTGVAVEWMAEPNATEAGLIGTGWQARGQLAALAAVRPIRVAYVYGRNDDRRQRFADQMSGELGIDVRAVDRPQEAVEELPIVVTATNSREPVLHGMWLAERALVCAIGSNWLNRAELDADTVRRADHVVCDSVSACKIEAGDFTDAIERGIFDWSKAVELADVVAGRAVGRGSRGGVSLFKSVGLAIEDVALGAKLLEQARAQGAGQALPL